MDQSSRALHGKLFADLGSEQQMIVLRQLEEGKAPGAIWKQASSSEFFGYVVDHTMQGFYGDPRHGGNREGVSWKMLGLPYPPIRGRQQNAPEETERVSDCADGSETRQRGGGRSGAGGGIVAKELAEAGLSVVLLERGKWFTCFRRSQRRSAQPAHLRAGERLRPG